MQEEWVLYPIFENDLEFLPQDEAEKKETTENVKITENVEITDIPEYVQCWVTDLFAQLEKDHIQWENGAENAMAGLFMRAAAHGDVTEGTKAEDYVKDIVLKLEFQLMLKGSKDENMAAAEDINQLSRDLFGGMADTKSVVGEKKEVNIVAKVSEERQTENKSEIAALFSGESVEDGKQTSSTEDEVLAQFLGNGENGENGEALASEKDCASEILKRKNTMLEFKETLEDPQKYFNPNLSVVDRLVGTVLIDTLTDLYDEYLTSEDGELMLLMVQEICINEKLNGLLDGDVQENSEMDWEQFSDMPAEVIDALKEFYKNYSEFLDDLMEDARQHYIKNWKKQ